MYFHLPKIQQSIPMQVGRVDIIVAAHVTLFFFFFNFPLIFLYSVKTHLNTFEKFLRGARCKNTYFGSHICIYIFRVKLQGCITVQVGRVAMTGTAYFELSLNHVDFDDVFRRWNDEWLLLSNDGVLQCVAVCCGVLRCVAVCCSVLQCVAVCCSRCESESR